MLELRMSYENFTSLLRFNDCSCNYCKRFQHYTILTKPLYYHTKTSLLHLESTVLGFNSNEALRHGVSWLCHDRTVVLSLSTLSVEIRFRLGPWLPSSSEGCLFLSTCKVRDAKHSTGVKRFWQILLPNVYAYISGCRKTLGVNYGQSLKMGPWSIIGVTGLFYRRFFTKTDNVVLPFATSECCQHPEPTVVRGDLS